MQKIPSFELTTVQVGLANGFTITDGLAPLIDWAIIGPAMAADGDAVRMAVDVSDNVGVTGVTANGTPLTYAGWSVWFGDIFADSALGLHPVEVVARDAANNSATDTSQSYKTARVVGINNRDLANHVTSAMAQNYLYVAWGRVTWIDADTFDLDDGSGAPIRVIASGHGRETNDYACARGIWQTGGTSHYLSCTASHVTKLN